MLIFWPQNIITQIYKQHFRIIPAFNDVAWKPSWIFILEWRHLTVKRATLTTKSGAAATLGNVRICPRFHWRWICSEVSTNLGWRNSTSCNCQATVSTCQTPSVTPPHPATKFIHTTAVHNRSRREVLPKTPPVPRLVTKFPKFMEPDSSLQPAVCPHT